MIRQVTPLLFGAVIVACARNRGPVGGASDGSVPFSISSIPSTYGIQARIEGRIAVRDRWVHVVAPAGAVRTYQLDRSDYWDLRLRAAVAGCGAGGVVILSEGRAARLAPLLGLTRDAASLDTATRALRDTLRLDVGVPAGTDVSRSWVAVVVEWPFQSVMAEYTLHTGIPLSGTGSPWSGAAIDNPVERCRSSNRNHVQTMNDRRRRSDKTP